MSAVGWKAISPNYQVFWTTLMHVLGPNHVFSVVTASVTADVITKGKFAVPEES